MSQFEELIQELCPGGVEYKKIKDVYTRLKGTQITASRMKQISTPDGEIKIFAGGKTVINAHEKDIEKANITRVPAVLVQSRGIIDVIYCEEPFTFKNEMWAYTYNNKTSVKYLYYVLKNNVNSFREAALKMGSMPQISLAVTEEFKIPVPPLEVQSEIVRILDNFTELTAELTEEITEEITARKKQYEYYRDALLKPKEKIPLVSLKDISTSFYRGSGIRRDQVTEAGIPCVRYGEIYTGYNTWFDQCISHTQLENINNPKYFEHGDILFAITGESIEDIGKSIAYVGNKKCLAGGDIVVMKHHQNPRYLAHVLNTTMARAQKSKGKVKSKVVHTNVASLEKIKIPLPSLDVQERYANVLDNFEAICSDLNIALPAELEVRQKQYEYYRDLLLTFAETGKTILPEAGSRKPEAGSRKPEAGSRKPEAGSQDVIKLLQHVFGYAPVKVKDIYTRIKGTSITARKMKEISNEQGDVKIFAGGKTLVNAFEENIPNANITKVPSVLIQSRGIIDVVYCDQAFTFKNEMWAYTHTNVTSVKYLYYALKKNINQFRERASGMGSMPQISLSVTEDFIIDLPSLEEQARIVAILDRFDALCNDLTSGLPSEIAARQKQYEYYRDQLLRFE